ncbi:MAG: YbgC/FadM family acyl-CoA thioesterase [Helicobacteraceae bacterium]|jgi:acyl-CoA thioester hydrolase|nr:YbgC/FadM family acyl-CoA thioesterase [Helicobacteraceae bacterium]
MQIRVYYEDTDLGGVVYHSNYLNFCERARSELFFSKGKSPVLESGHFVAKSLEANYIKSALFADILEVKTELTSLKFASFTLRQSIYRGEEKIFEMKIKLAYLTHAGEIGRFDDETRAMLKELLS